MNQAVRILSACLYFFPGLLFEAGAQEAKPTAAQAAQASLVKFTRDVRPILARHCFACHGPDENQRKGKLRLDLKESAFADRQGARPFAPGSVDDSEAIRRIQSDDPTEQMPPGGKDKGLTAEQTQVLVQWVEQGAAWGTHWAFEKPVRAPLPEVRDPKWPKNPIDWFVLARLDREGLKPAPEADRATLLRRVCLDLTGLPPTPEMADRFVRDSAPDAYERLVDRLLQSPAYGERWARMWLDLARYADSKGYEKDLTRSIWRYRDWVIDAFNSDMPYDRFTTLQLAGDLVGGAGPDELLATAFHRNTLTNDEGGTDDEEFRIAAVKDRVDTTVQVWMGLTMGCAKCHTHKYDPISNREYYQFFAFFNQTADSDRYDDGPVESFPSASQQSQMTALRSRVDAIESTLFTTTPERMAAAARWEESQRTVPAWVALRPGRMNAASGSTLVVQADGSIKVEGAGPAKESYRLECDAPLDQITGLRLEALPDPSLPRGGAGRSPGDGNFVLSGISIALETKDGHARELPLASARADFAQDGYPVEHVLKNPDLKKHGWAVAPRQAEAHQAVFTLAQAAKIEARSKLVVKLDHQFEHSYPGLSMGRFRISLTADRDPKLSSPLPKDLAEILAIPAEKRSKDQTAKLLKHYLESTPEVRSKREEVARLRAEIDALLAASRTPIFRELPDGKKRVTRVHRRGNFLDQGDPVDPATPSFFPPLPKDAPRNRLGVARWLLAPDNPLTARVEVNRHWAQFFGRGLVETQEDFGAQGQPPSHPELLDWLACEFRDGGWSMKRLCRLIVTSATYRQSSRVTPELIHKDRDNRLLRAGRDFASRPR